MKLGIAGVGRIGASHAGVLCRHPEVDAVVVADVDEGRARQVAEQLGCDSTGDVSELLSGGVDGLVVATSTSTHAELVVAAARAGLPVFCEKPVASDVHGTRLVLDEVTRLGTPVQVGFQRRFDRGYARARQALRDGVLGELHRVHVITADPVPPAPEYLPTSGGIFRDCHIHDFDILRWVTGREVVAVVAVGANRGATFFRTSDDVDNSAALLTMDDGTLVTLQGSRYNGAGYDVRMELAGNEGTWVVGLDDRVPLTSAEPDVSFPNGVPWPSFWERFTPAYEAELDHFVGVVRGARDSGCTVADALEALYVAEAATLSRARGGVVVRIDEVRQ
jgi:myo-inositol 2-dehydrogenase/D-chiro-inositol 1-dehydrogenase